MESEANDSTGAAHIQPYSVMMNNRNFRLFSFPTHDMRIAETVGRVSAETVCLMLLLIDRK
jgi:hypothetical protein